ncbi:M28 family peptidase [Psychroflexus sp. YR1-1]|uniref:M28 family peptidase n=1 Tax=Psychroflexus aurantiacus TaxID=2709310 RepID=A0A6B3R2P1_9FLAO|nr:M28 family peptidase [Psychroflexus aurantiacus]NEV93327.1 M28 family peptidase [Psychroflexus aurantiacus]
MKGFLFSFSLLIAATLQAQDLTGYSLEASRTQLELETRFRESIDSTRFKSHLKTLTEHPHIAGTPANEKVKDYIVKSMSQAGLDVENYPYDIYMSSGPGESLVEVMTPESIVLDQQEKALADDPYSSDPGLVKGWNAYSGSGDVTAQVVYANYGTKADFEKLEDLGISVEGKIVIARYGGNFRGYKAKFAEAYGAAGLIIYTDPKDSGFTKGLVFPDGVYYNDSGIQRGSLLTADWTGDPLTPYEPALPRDDKDSPERLDPKDVGLHTIPVTPISYGAADHIFKHMKGEAVPQDWQGGLPYTYRLQGGSELTVRLKVDQPKKFTEVYNIVGTLKGKTYPDEWIILGCHYDAWAFGATDPNSGTAMLLSLSETLGKMAKTGNRPERSILIAHWDAEEHGVIGSSEWVEQFKDELKAKAVAYINLDAAVSGKNFGASSSPSLKTVLAQATKKVDYPYTEETVYEHWSKDNDEPSIGNLGGGSDHIAFYMHAGVPSLSGGTRGPTLYHTNYDDFYFYENFVDPEFQMGPTVEAVMGTLSLRLANAAILPYDVVKYATDLDMHFKNAEKQVRGFYSDFAGFKASTSAISSLEATANLVAKAFEEQLQNGNLSKKKTKRLNAKLLALEKSFLYDEGMPYGDWYKSLYASSDPFSGYASWILPGLQYQIEMENKDKLSVWDERYADAISHLNAKLVDIMESL